MKKIKILIPVLVLSLLLGSCQKFVDIKKDNSQSFIETANDCQLLLDNYSLFNVNDTYDGELSADDFFLLNSYYGAATTAQEDRDVFTWQPTSIRKNAGQYVVVYNKIYHANLVLDAVAKISKNGGSDPATLGGIKGAALFFRAFSFWNIAQLYTRPYGSNSSTDPGIPLRLTADINDVTGRGTVQGTYEKIIADLKEAETLLQVPPVSQSLAIAASRPGKIAALAMLARVYLSMGDYPNALSNANAALQLKSILVDYNTLSKTSTVPFTRFNSEVIFQSATANHPMINPGSVSNAIARVDKTLYDAYLGNDLRKTIFFKANTMSYTYPEPTQANPAATKTIAVPDGTYRFTGNYDGTTAALQFDGLATDELYLIKAECQARGNLITEAMTTLNDLLKTRWNTNSGTTPYVNLTAGSQDDAITKILLERRKELLMRRQRWTDLRRLNKDPRFAKTLTREINTLTVSGTTATNYTFTSTLVATYTLPPNDPRYTLMLPLEVITNSNLPQNIR